jgi:protein-L-isoaspartate(D-aspartate) O-methyltransferase
MIDTATEKEGLAALLLRLRAIGVDNNRLLGAVESIPRSVFLTPDLRANAYSPKIMPIDCGGFSESIDVLVRILNELDAQSNHKVLEIGCGSGYSAAVLSKLSDRVLTIDRYMTHVTNAIDRFDHVGITNVIAKQLDGSNGVEGEGTFDRILVTASFKEMPRQFVDHLTSNGVMIAPMSLGDGRARIMRLTKIGSRFEREDLFEIQDSPLIPNLASAL